MNTKQKLDKAIQALQDIASSKYTRSGCVEIAKQTLDKIKSQEEHDNKKPKG